MGFELPLCGSVFYFKQKVIEINRLHQVPEGPFLYGLYWKRTTKAACWASFLFGAGIMILNLVLKSSFPVLLQSPINCGAFAMLAGLVIVPVVSLITKKPDQALVDEAFACYEKKAPVSQKTALHD